MRSFSGQPLHRSDASINHNRRWTENEIKKLRCQGQSGDWDDIAESFKRTPDACRRRYGRLKAAEPWD